MQALFRNSDATRAAFSRMQFSLPARVALFGGFCAGRVEDKTVLGSSEASVGRIIEAAALLDAAALADLTANFDVGSTYKKQYST